jgi:multidrug transporter EmrE-like cation transporter
VLLSAAAGTIYGFAAGLIKSVGHQLSLDVPRTFVHWQPYGLAVVGIAGMLVAQSAFQAGALDVSLPTMTAIDPVISILIGALAFDEHIAVNGPAVAAEVVSLLVMVAGVYGLTAKQRARRTPVRID